MHLETCNRSYIYLHPCWYCLHCLHPLDGGVLHWIWESRVLKEWGRQLLFLKPCTGETHVATACSAPQSQKILNFIHKMLWKSAQCIAMSISAVWMMKDDLLIMPSTVTGLYKGGMVSCAKQFIISHVCYWFDTTKSGAYFTRNLKWTQVFRNTNSYPAVQPCLCGFLFF